MEFNINKEMLTEFIGILDAISKNCTDCQINTGKIRIRSNNKILLYDITLSDFFNNLNLCISSVANFLDLLKMFVPQNDDELVSIKLLERSMLIKDQYTNLEIDLASPDSLQNKFVSDDMLNKLNFFNKNTLFHTELNNTIVDRINAILKNFGVTVITLNVQNGILKLQIKSGSKTKVADFTISNPNISNIPDGVYLTTGSLFSFPFEENVEFSIYELNPSQYMAGVKELDKERYIFSGLITETRF